MPSVHKDGLRDIVKAIDAVEDVKELLFSNQIRRVGSEELLLRPVQADIRRLPWRVGRRRCKASSRQQVPLRATANAH